MTTEYYSGTAWVEIQGDRVLRFMRLGTDHAEYQVIGFEGPITVKDFRQTGLQAIQQVLATKQVDKFALQFNMPAQVNISDLGMSKWLIELHDTNDSDPQHRLWLAIGIRDYVPVYDYIVDRVAPIDESRLVFLALYRRQNQSDASSLESPSPTEEVPSN